MDYQITLIYKDKTFKISSLIMVKPLDIVKTLTHIQRC